MRSCYHEDFTKKYLKLPDICSKNFENHKFSFTPAEKRSRDSSLRPVELKAGFLGGFKTKLTFCLVTRKVLFRSSRNFIFTLILVRSKSDIFSENDMMKDYELQVIIYKTACTKKPPEVDIKRFLI